MHARRAAPDVVQYPAHDLLERDPVGAALLHWCVLHSRGSDVAHEVVRYLVEEGRRAAWAQS